VHQSFKIAAVYAGGVIGAGFASGREILQFFIEHGERGLWGAFIACVLFIYLGAVIMALSVSLGTQNYLTLLKKILGLRLAKIIDILSLFMLPGGYAVMLAGSGAVFREHLGLPPLLGVLCTAGFSILVLLRGVRGFIAINAILVPLKIAAILMVCLGALLLQSKEGMEAVYNERQNNSLAFAWSGVLYVSYNMIVPVAVLSSLGKSVRLAEGILGGVLGGIAIGLIIILVTASGLAFYPAIAEYEIPLLYMASFLPGIFKSMLGVMIWIAILTTAVADVHGFASRLSIPGSKNYKLIGIVLVFCTLPLASLKFSLLVKILYPLFGYCGLILLAGLLFVPAAAVISGKIKLLR
jgi:uncharacterized membrane protein YkvI